VPPGRLINRNVIVTLRCILCSRDRPILFLWNRYQYFQIFHQYLASFRYFIEHRYR